MLKLKLRKFITPLSGILSAVVLTASALPASAAPDYPHKRVSVIVPHSVGGGQDRLTRALVDVWSKHLGAKVVSVPKPGASGRVGMDYFVRQVADGSSVASFNLSTVGLMYAQQQPDWSWEENIEILGIFGLDPGGIFVHKDSPYKSIDDVIKSAKSETVVVGVPLWGSSGNMVAHQLKQQIGVQLHPVPAGGGSAVVTAVLGKHVPVGFGKLSSILKGGDKVRFLAMAYPNNPVPTLTGNAPILDDILKTKTIPSASYRVIAVSPKFKENHPDLYKKLKTSFEAAKDDKGYIAKAKKAKIPKELILDTPEEKLEETLRLYWTAFNESGAFLTEEVKSEEVNAVLSAVKSDGKYILFNDEKGRKWKTRIHKAKTKFWINGEQIEGKKAISSARKQLKKGDTCSVTYVGMPIIAQTAKCTSS